MSIVTKGGDKGETSLLGGQRVKKTDDRIEAYGTLDELNASIGVALTYIKNIRLKQVLTQVQNDLFKIGAELASIGTQVKQIPKINPARTDELEQEVKRIEQELPKQTSFILPAGNEAAAHLHLARTICRRAERTTIKLSEKHPVDNEIIKYLNRLSDLLFIYARQENKGKDEPVNYT